MKLAAVVLAGLLANAGHASLPGTFSSPIAIGGAWGSTSVDNSFYTADPGTPNLAGFPAQSPVWFKFSATNDGEVSIDTIGSTNFYGQPLDTVLAVYGGTNLTSLYQIAANDDLYPNRLQSDYYSETWANQNTYQVDTNSGGVTASSSLYNFPQPFTGPSSVRFNVKAGSVYYIAADSMFSFKSGQGQFVYSSTGPIALNWAYHSSGAFRFASENVEQTGLTDASGNPLLLYQCSTLESRVLLTVTRVGGYTGRATVQYQTMDGAPGLLSNGDLPAVGYVTNVTVFTNPVTHLPYFTNTSVLSKDYTPITNGILTFDDFEMSKTISISIRSSGTAAAAPNRDFTVLLSNPLPDPQESAAVSAPRVDPVFNKALVRILNLYSSPFGAEAIVDTNGPVPVTNYVTDNAFNFGEINYRVERPITSNSTYTYTIWVSRTGAQNIATNIYYQVNSGWPFYNTDPYYFNTLQNMRFPLQPGSDYATPDPANGGNVLGANPDFIFSGGYSGTISWGDKDMQSKPLSFTVYNNGQVNFNEDFHIELFARDGHGNVMSGDVGMVGEITVTLLFQDQNPPAGSVDEKFNADFNLDLANMQIGSSPPNMKHPGTDGQVYGVAVQSDDKTVIVGDFFSYNGNARNCIARVNTDGSLDTSFNPGGGVGAVPGYNNPPIFINAITFATNTSQLMIAGSFVSYNGTPRGNVARLNSDGTLDTTFNPGAGANGPVWAILQQGDGNIIIGGNFTSYNGTPCHNLARLHYDGSLDTAFNAGNALTNTVYALAEQGGTFIKANRNASGGQARDDNFINIGAPSGILTVDYDMLMQPDDMRVYYGSPTNGVLIYDTGWVSYTGHLVIPFGPTNGLTFNAITIVMNETNGQFGTAWSYTASVESSFANQIYVGGDFTSVSGIPHQDHLARLLGDGSVDTTFDPNAGINGPVYALAVQPDGKVLAGGEFSQVNNQAVKRFTRLNQDGTIDANFYSGVGLDGTVYNLNLQGDGTMYVGGAFTAVNGTHRLGFARLHSDGTVDTSFLDCAYNQFAGLPRKHFSDPVGTVFASGLQSDGSVMIGGSFDQVGGGQYNPKVRPESNTNSYHETFERDGIRNRSNFAKLIGGGTPGPGNIGLLENSYSVNKSASDLFVSLLRTNGSLGFASANFSVVPGVAQSATDFSYSSPAPAYGMSWDILGSPPVIPFTRMRSDGMFGTNTFLADPFGRYFEDAQAQVLVSVINNNASSGDLSAQFQLANPANADQFYLGGQNIPLGVALGLITAPLTIVDDQHQSGVVGFAGPDYVGGAASGPVVVPVEIIRTNGNYGDVSVTCTTVTNGSTATVGSDYDFNSAPVIIRQGTTTNFFPVTVKTTNYISAVEKFINLQLSDLQAPADGLASLGLVDARLRIINPNFAGFLDFTASNYFGTVSAGFVPVTVTRIVGSKGTVTVHVSTSNGTAVNGTDYTGISTNLQWNNGDVSPRILMVPLLSASALGSTNFFNVTLSSPALNGTNWPTLFTNTISTPTNAMVIITNDLNGGTFQFSAADYTVNENGGYATITVTRTGSMKDLQIPASVDYATADYTALDTVNYSATADTLFFGPGETAQSFTVPILDDLLQNLPPDQFYFQVNLSNPGGGSQLGSQTTANVHIVDAESYNRPPGSGDTTFNASPGMNGSVFALAQQSDGRLVAGGTFTTVNGSVENYFARLNGDGSVDNTGFLFGLAGANNAVYALANQSDDRVVIGGLFTTVNGVARNRLARVMTDGSLDTSFNPGLGADNTVYSLAETFVNDSRKIYAGGAFQTVNAGPHQFLVRLNNNGSVDTSFNPGLGPDGVVYAVTAYPTNSPFAGKVLIGGAFTNVNNFPVAHFARLNADGSVDTNFDASLGAGGTVRAIVIQPDGGIVIGGDFTNVFDGYSGFENFSSPHIARILDDGNGYSHVDSDFAANLGTGANGPVDALALQADNRIVVAGEFTQASGVTRNCITRLMPDGSVDASINFGSGASGAVYAALVQAPDQMMVLGGAFTQYNGEPHNRIVRIYGGSETGSGAFEFTSASYTVPENGLDALVTIRRVGGTDGTNSVDFTTSDGTAVAGTNYLSRNVTVVFPPGEVLKTVAVPVMDDGVVTPDLTVNLNLSNTTAGYGDQTNAVLTIQNVDSTVSFSTPNFFVAKNVLTGEADIHVIRSGTTIGTCQVDFLTTTNGTAVPGLDFYPTNVTVTFNPGEMDKVVQVGITNNLLPRGNQTVVFALSNAVNTVLAAPTNAMLTIIDTVYAPGILSFLTNSIVVNEGDGNAYLTVIRTNGASGIVSVAYTTTVGTAVPGVNYVTTTGTLTFGDTVNSGTIIIPLVDNSLAQGTVDFSVTLSNPNGGASLLSPTTCAVAITDNDTGIAFAAATNRAPEDAGFVNVIVQRLYNFTPISSVNYATVNGTAVAGINYSNTFGTLNFTNGEVFKSISVPLVHDTNANGDLTFTLQLTSPVNAQIVAPSNTVVVIQDAEAGVHFNTNAQRVLKSSGFAVVTVVCSNPRVEPVLFSTNDIPLEVSYTTKDGTALAGTDYQAVSGTLVFTNGLATNTFSVPIYNNNLVTGDHAFTVVLTNVTAPGLLTAPSTQTVVIAESNAGLRFSQSNYKVFKNGIFATIEVDRTGYTNSVASVDYLATNGTALAGVNFVSTNGTLVFSNGVTSQTFNVALIANTKVQPNLTVNLQLLNPTNGILVKPAVATLTILENGGSYVIPAGSQVVTNYTSHAADGIINSNDTVQVLFGLRDSAGLNVTNLIAYLLATNGVIAPSPASQTYGPLTVYGHSVSRAFTFTAHGTNTLTIAPTFALYDNAKFIGTAAFNFTLGAWTTVFASTNAIVINDNTNASPYPSLISVSGVGKSLVKATVTLTNLTHADAYSIGALVESPAQKSTLIMGHAGNGYGVNHVTLTFDDAAATLLPPSAQIVTGTNKPSGYNYTGVPFP